MTTILATISRFLGVNATATQPQWWLHSSVIARNIKDNDETATTTAI